MHYGRRNKDFAYTMNPEDPADKMEVTTEENDLGVTFSRDLKLSTHVAKAAKLLEQYDVRSDIWTKICSHNCIKP